MKIAIVIPNTTMSEAAMAERREGTVKVAVSPHG